MLLNKFFVPWLYIRVYNDTGKNMMRIKLTKYAHFHGF